MNATPISQRVPRIHARNGKELEQGPPLSSRPIFSRSIRFTWLAVLLLSMSVATLMAAPGDENWDDRFGGQGVSSFVSAVAVIGSNVYAGGNFEFASGLGTNVGSIPAIRIACWNGRSWSALGEGVNNNVTALAVIGSDLYVGGSFTNAGGADPSRYFQIQQVQP